MPRHLRENIPDLHIEDLSHIPLPGGCSLTSEEWLLTQLILRYTGCRLCEMTGMQAEWVIKKEGVPLLGLERVTIPYSHRADHGGAMRFVPVHPSLEEALFTHASRLKSGDLFPNHGKRNRKVLGPRETSRRGREFAMHYIRKAREIWRPMNVYSWRQHAVRHLARSGGATEAAVRRLMGYSDLKFRRCEMPALYEVVKMLP